MPLKFTEFPLIISIWLLIECFGLYSTVFHPELCLQFFQSKCYLYFSLLEFLLEFLSPQYILSEIFYLGYMFAMFYIENMVSLSITLFDIKEII